MSRTYFHTENEGTAELRGWESALLHMLPRYLAQGFLPTFTDDLRKRLKPECARYAELLNRGVLLGGHAGDAFIDHDGSPLQTQSLVLNTAMKVCSDPYALAVRIGAQQEIHCYVEGPNRAWMADLIVEGRAQEFIRAKAGWEKIVELLRGRDDAPVVCSYSGTDGFPNADVANWQAPVVDGEEDYEAWHDVFDEDQWRLAIEGLRGSSDGLEIRPDNLHCTFGHNKSLIDLFVVSPADLQEEGKTSGV